MSVQKHDAVLYRLSFPSGKCYIGITLRGISRRMSLHRYHAKNGRQGAIYSAIRKYGLPKPDILVVGPSWEYLCELERKAISAFGSKHPQGYNLTDGGEGNYGGKWTENHAAAASKRRGVPTGRRPTLGMKFSEETRAKVSAALTGRPCSAETRAKIGATHVGNKYNVGRIVSEETRRKIRESNIRTKAINPRPVLTEAGRRAISEAAKRRWEKVRVHAFA